MDNQSEFLDHHFFASTKILQGKRHLLLMFVCTFSKDIELIKGFLEVSLFIIFGRTLTYGNAMQVAIRSETF